MYIYVTKKFVYVHTKNNRTHRARRVYCSCQVRRHGMSLLGGGGGEEEATNQTTLTALSGRPAPRVASTGASSCRTRRRRPGGRAQRYLAVVRGFFEHEQNHAVLAVSAQIVYQGQRMLLASMPTYEAVSVLRFRKGAVHYICAIP